MPTTLKLLTTTILLGLTQVAVLFRPNVAYIPPEWDSVFPTSDFNRNVSVRFWQTILDPPSPELQSTLVKSLNVSFIVYEKSFYKMCQVQFQLLPSINAFDCPLRPTSFIFTCLKILTLP